MAERDHQPPMMPALVAIGASAGGLHALQNLFEDIPEDLGAAYLVVQHLSPEFRSEMDSILGKVTGMDVHEVRDGEELRANCVYLTPARKRLLVEHGRLRLDDPPLSATVDFPIDECFHSVAAAAGRRAVGIVLSGSGSDGSRGVSQLKEAGALVLAQDPAEAEFDGMPRNAIATGCVSIITRVEEMAGRIEQFLAHPLTGHAARWTPSDFAEHPETMRQVLEHIHVRTGVDLKAYKETTVARRLEHRMIIRHCHSIADYRDLLLSDDSEPEAIKQDLLIGVTRFFRDGKAWERLRDSALPEVIANAEASETIRAWSAGCATGEEAYTLAILLLEALEHSDSDLALQVFASDIDEHALAYAAEGVYPARIEDEVPPALLEKYFARTAEGDFRVRDHLRDAVMFSRHDILQDPPFSNMTLSVCRNTLIYMQGSAQRVVVAALHFSLRLGGFLLLGSAETPGVHNSHFDTIDSRERLYRRNSAQRIRSHRLPEPALPQAPKRPATALGRPRGGSARAARRTLRSPGQNFLFRTYVPPTFIVDRDTRVRSTFGDTRPFADALREGSFTSDLGAILLPEVGYRVLTTVRRALAEGRSILQERAFAADIGGERRSWSVKCTPVDEAEQSEPLVAVSFLEDSRFLDRATETTEAAPEHSEGLVTYLEGALRESQQAERDTQQELASTVQELHQSNEEIRTANEELQSTNEELQSVNEELYTVNSENRLRIAELSEINADFENLMRSTGMALLFLTPQLRIRRFTNSLKDFVNVLDVDVQRDFRDLSFKHPMPGIVHLIEQVNETQEAHSQIFEDEDGTRIEAAVDPYYLKDKVSGVMVALRQAGAAPPEP